MAAILAAVKGVSGADDENVLAVIQRIKTEWVALAADGFDWVDVPKVVRSAIVELAPVMIELSIVDEDERKRLTLLIVGATYDAVIRPIDLPLIPNAIEPMVDDGLGRLVDVVAHLCYDGIMKQMRAAKEPIDELAGGEEVASG